jgi:predicted GNAT family N-acyltransferase
MTPMSEWQVHEAAWRDDEDALMAVRTAVFVVEQGVPAEMEREARDATAFHLIARAADERPVATARLLPDGQIGRMAVLAEWRGHGLGTELLRRLLDAARRQGLRRVFVHAQCRAEIFYRREGFMPEGEAFDEAGITHRKMTRELAKETSHHD